MNISKKTWLIVGIAVLVVGSAAAVAGITVWGRSAPEKVAAQYLEALEAKDTQREKELSCSAGGTRREMPEIRSWEIVKSAEGEDIVQVTVKIEFAADNSFYKTGLMNVTVLNQYGVWRVCGMSGY